ncbi:TonB-dependent receptor [Microbulbifer bruguierae]|uniref:TonB-dependent receptor n=1 Tax=Microbulbifer bruguierae TaxID=3029061 RepID=A0ABY8NCH0_9GAMM|nr:TonB-dependent receptor [Microbulbifer bruguierae]WGL16498.1 TonB-dependent receptor [Microbulbifer bruguierae]
MTVSRLSFPLSALTLAILASGNTAFAQQQSADPGQAQLEEISVTGQRLARTRSLDIKRNSAVVMDALATDELGRLPDKNAAESLNRLPGVSILIEKGEGRFASIRGIKPDWNRVNVNGFVTGSPEKDGSGRSMPLDLLGGELLQGVEVYKAKTADMDGEGIGGAINIVTKRPLAGEGFEATANVRMGMEEADQDNPYYDGKNPHNFDVAASGKFSEKLGWNLGASSTAREYLAQGIYQDDWTVIDGLAFPEQSKNNYYVVGRDRATLIGGLEYRLNDSTDILAQGFYSNFEEFQHRNRFRQGVEPDADLILATAGDTVTMAEGASYVRADVRREDTEKQLANFSLAATTDLDTWHFDYGINISRSELRETNSEWDFRQLGSVELGPDAFFINGEGVVEFSAGGTQHNLADNLRFHSMGLQDDRVEQDTRSFKLDAEHLYRVAGVDATLKMGVKYTESEKQFDFNSREYDVARVAIRDYSVTGGSFRNDVDGQMRDNLWFDLSALNRLFESDPGLFSEADNRAAILGGDRLVEENTSAIYGMNTFSLDQLDLIVGLRYEQTDIRSSAKQRNAEGAYSDIAISGNSDVLLPSLVAKYVIRDNLIARASYTTSMGRPDYADLSAVSRFSIDDDGDALLSIGNPDLKPYEADNYDFSVEWYPSESSVVSLAWFRKDIDNIIVNDEVLVDGGVYLGSDYGVEELTVRTVKNSDTADVAGYEFNVQHQFSNLPAPLDGLGASFSYTNIDATFFDSNLGVNRKLEGQPEEIQSFTLFFENYGFYAGLTYNYNASFLTDLNNLEDLSDDIDQGEFGRWDLRASYVATDKLSVYLDINNLNNEPTTEFQGGNERWNTEYEYVGSSYYLGATYAF